MLDGLSEWQISQHINQERIDDEDLVERSTWRAICRARGRNYRKVDPEAWRRLCGRRGYLLYRRNARGF